MIFNVTGGGGSGLYYDVVCQIAEPTKKEGRIWVKSAVPITTLEWANTPWSGGAVGRVCIGGKIGGYNPTASNNVIMVIDATRNGVYHNMKFTPSFCKQVQGSTGNWVSVDAYVCHSNTWVNFSSAFSATITITYPSGATCTCTDGTTTLTSPNTSGTWACVVPNTGTWTIKYQGANWTSVSITSDGQNETVYAGYLYYNGNQLTDITGGWTTSGYTVADGNAGVTVGTSTIKLSSTTNSTRSAIGTANKVSLPSGCTQLCMRFQITDGSGGSLRYGLDSDKSIGNGTTSNGGSLCYYNRTATTSGYMDGTLDISSVTVTSAYIYAITAGGFVAEISQIWLK